MQFDIGLVELIQNLLSWASPFFRVITDLGSELFYIALILVGYWGFKKRETIMFGFVLIISFVLNYWLKIAIKNPRPDSSYWYPGADPPNYSTPSGHAQSSATVFGWIAAKGKRVWLFVLSTVLVLLIGLSRVVLGVHYLEDILLGWGIGILIVVVMYLAEPPLSAFISNQKEVVVYSGLFIIGLIATAVTSLLVPPDTIPAQENFGAFGGLIMGLAISLPLEKRYVNFEIEPISRQNLKPVIRIVIGLVLVIGLLLGLSIVLLSEVVWMRTLRYLIVTVFGVLIWPAIFKRANL
ncbi:MAG: phosphatase PAP2 family protein [Candidatus Thorarchaeota archaeon]